MFFYCKYRKSVKKTQKICRIKNNVYFCVEMTRLLLNNYNRDYGHYEKPWILQERI